MSDTAVKGLPSNLDAERFVLGSILLDDGLYVQVDGKLAWDDFSIENTAVAPLSTTISMSAMPT
jgi:hypothetical protein